MLIRTHEEHLHHILYTNNVCLLSDVQVLLTGREAQGKTADSSDES